MSDVLKSTSYTHQDPQGLPVDWNSRPALPWDEVCSVVGFDPRGNEIVWGSLSAEWNGHPMGAAVLTGPAAERRWFAVVERLDSPAPQAKPYQIRRRSLRREGRLVAYEYAMADPGNGRIYPASPRVRCRPSQHVECHKLFQEQARTWATGGQVPWSQYLPQA